MTIGNGKKRMLVVRFSALGDVAMTIPVVYSLARQYPNLHIDFVTTPFFSKLFINAPENLTVHGIDVRKDYHGIKGTLRLLKRLSALHPDYVADLHNVFRSWIIDCWFRAKGKEVAMVDKMRRGRKNVIRQKNVQPSFFDRYADVFFILGFPMEMTFSSLFHDITVETPVRIEKPAVGIAPFARYANKTYPLPLMEEVVADLTSRDINVYLFGGRGKEAEEMDIMAGKYKNCVSLAGKFPIEEELAVLSKMDVMVSMDSANHHLASLTSTPVVSIWGSTTPACGFMGYGQESRNAICLGLPCQPCTIAGSPDCPRHNMECLTELKPETICNKILAFVKKGEKQ